MRYRIEQTVKVDGVRLPAGTEVDADEIPAGCLASMLRLGQAAPAKAEKPTDPPKPPEPKPAKK